jgi:hypothetical protein
MGTTGQFKAAAARLERSGCGPIGPHLDGFADWLSEQGYARGSGMKKIGLPQTTEVSRGTAVSFFHSETTCYAA